MPTSRTKNLEVILNYRDKLSGKAPQTIKALMGIERQAKRTASAIEKVNKAMGGALRAPRAGGGSRLPPELQRGAGLTRQLAAEVKRTIGVEREQTRLLREQVKLRQDGVRLAGLEARTARASSGGELAELRAMRERVRLQREELKLHTDARRSRGRGRLDGRGYLDSVGNRMTSAAGAGQAFRGAIDTAVDFAQPALREMRAEARFGVMGYPDGEAARGLSAVNESLTKVRGVTRADAVETLTALTSTFGSVDEATQFLPISLKYRANMQTLWGDMYSPADINRQIGNTYKALELIGVDRPTGPKDATGQRSFTDQDRARMESYFNQVAKAMAATGGDINPAEFRNFAKYGGNVAMGLSPEGLSKVLPLLQQVGGARLGTSLTSLNQNLVLGQMPAYKLNRWDELGLLDKSKVEFTQAGLIKRMKPGAIPMAETLKTDPLAFAEGLRQKFEKRGVDTTDFNKVNQEVGSLIANRTSQNIVAQMINFQASLDKEARNYQRALGVNETYGKLFDAQNPLANFVDLRTKWQDGQAREGRGLVNKAGGVAGTVSGWMTENPDAAAALTGITALGRASTEAAGGVGLLRDALGGLRGGDGGGGGRGGGLAGSGVSAADLVIGGGWLTGQLKRRLGLSLGGALLSRGGLPGAVLATAAASTYAIHSNYQSDVAQRERARTDAGATYERLKAERAQRGGVLPRETADHYLSQVMPQGPTPLLISLEPKVYGGPGYPGVSLPAPHRNEQVIGEFRRQMPALELPEIMAAYVRQTRQRADAGQMPRAAAERAVSVAQSAFPESFKAAGSQLSGEAQMLVQGAVRFNSSLALLNNFIANPFPQIGGNQQAQTPQTAAAALAVLATETPRTTQALGKVTTPADELRAALARAVSGVNAFGARLSSWQPPTLTIAGQVIGTAAPGGPLTAPPPAFGPRRPSGFNFNKSESAIGSIVERDGLVSAHKGNVIFPARLSRRSPGDWLESAKALTSRDRRSPADELRLIFGRAGDSPSPDARAAQWDAAEAGGAADPVESAGAPDYSLFQTARAGGREITVNVGGVHVSGGADARETGAAVAAEIERRVQEALARIAAVEGDLYDPRFLANMAVYEINRRRDRT